MAQQAAAQPGEEKASNFEIALMGGWLIVSPLVLGFVTVARAAWPTVICGILLGLFGFRHALRPDKEGVIPWVNGLLGLVVLLSPWIFGFRRYGLAFGSNVLIGAAVIYFSSRGLLFGPRRTLVET